MTSARRKPDGSWPKPWEGDPDIWQGPMPSPHHYDKPLPDATERPCNRCGVPMRPTPRRRMLCSRCFREGDSAPVYIF